MAPGKGTQKRPAKRRVAQGTRQTGNTGSRPACPGCRKHEKSHSRTQQVWTKCLPHSRCHAGHWGYRDEPNQRWPLPPQSFRFTGRRVGRSQPPKTTLMNMSLQTQMSTRA